MNRRAFLAWLGGTAAGAALAPTLDLERLLWLPNQRTIFVPDGFSNVSIDWIVREALKILSSKLTIADFNREYDAQFEFAKTGDEIHCVDWGADQMRAMSRAQIRRQIIDPGVSLLSDRVRDKALVRPLPHQRGVESAVATDANTGLSIRGVFAYNLPHDMPVGQLHIGTGV